MAKKVTVIDKRSSTAIDADNVGLYEYFVWGSTLYIRIGTSEKGIRSRSVATNETRTTPGNTLVIPVNVVITIVGDE